jgi:F-type H+-transporting ATPase subunit epsilon
MAKNFQLEIIASDHPFYKGDCEMLVIPGTDGLHGILADHEPMVTCLSPGEIKFQVNGEWHYAAVSEGFVEIMPHHVILLGDTIEKPEDIDEHRAEEAKMRAEERLLHKLSQDEYYRSRAALNRAMNRLKVKRNHIN